MNRMVLGHRRPRGRSQEHLNRPIRRVARGADGQASSFSMGEARRLLLDRAQYVVELPELDDWGVAFDMMQAAAVKSRLKAESKTHDTVSETTQLQAHALLVAASHLSTLSLQAAAKAKVKRAELRSKHQANLIALRRASTQQTQQLSGTFYGTTAPNFFYMALDLITVVPLVGTMSLSKPLSKLAFTRPTSSLLGAITVSSLALLIVFNAI